MDQQNPHQPSPSSSAAASPTISSNPPPVLAGCTKKYRCPPAPTRTVSLTSRTPCSLNRTNIASTSSTCTATWCNPSPRFAKNLPIVESSCVASSSSILLSPSGSIAVFTSSCSTVSSSPPTQAPKKTPEPPLYFAPQLPNDLTEAP